MGIPTALSLGLVHRRFLWIRHAGACILLPVRACFAEYESLSEMSMRNYSFT